VGSKPAMPCYLVTVSENGRAVSERTVKCDDELIVKQAMMYGFQVMLSIKVWNPCHSMSYFLLYYDLKLLWSSS